MDCLKLEIMLADYFEGELPPQEVEELLAHVEECATCRAEFQAYQKQEEQLTRFFQLKTERLEKLEQPTRRITKPRAVPRLISRRYWNLAAAALFVVAVGYGAFLFLQDPPIDSDSIVATATIVERSVHGTAVQLFEEDQIKDVGFETPVRQGGIIKVPVGGYLALTLNDGSILEARGGAKLALYEYRKKLEVEMDLGDIWVHQAKRSKKPVVVKTAHLDAGINETVLANSVKNAGVLAHLTLLPPKQKAPQTKSSALQKTDAVFGVFEGLDRSVVMVATGTVHVDSEGKNSRTEVKSGQTFTSRPDAPKPSLAAAAAMVNWSSFHPASKKVSGSVAMPDRPLLVGPVQPTHEPNGRVPAPLPLVELLPLDARVFFSMRDCPKVLQSFKQTDYSKVMNQDAVRQWLAVSSGIRAQIELEQAVEFLNQAAGLVQVLDGDLVFGVNPRGHFLLAADCAMSEEEIWEKIRDLVLAVEEAQAALSSPEKIAEAKEAFAKHVEIANGRLVASNSPQLLSQTLGRLQLKRSSGFGQAPFHNKLLKDVTDPRLMIAVDLESLIDEQLKQLPPDAPEVRLLKMLGFADLDYLLLSPNFKGTETNQAARLSFVDARHGAANWLAEPAPMRGLNYFSPEVSFFAAAITQEPRTIIFDCLDLMDLEQDKLGVQAATAIIKQHEALFNAFGNEIVIGLDNPVFPSPNLKIVAEVRDRTAAEAGINKLLDRLEEVGGFFGQTYMREQSVYEGHTIHQLSIEGFNLFFKPAWCFVDDYLIIGTKPEYIMDAIAIADRGDSIAQHPPLLDLLSGRPEKDFSLLVYQDVAKVIQGISQTGLADLIGFENMQMLANADSAKLYSSASVAYACAHPGYIDLFMSTPKGIDLHMEVAAPMISKLFDSEQELSETAMKCGQAMTRLEQTRDAVMTFALVNNRPPATLLELVQPSGNYLASIPADPFGLPEGSPLRMIAGPEEGEITLYSIGPDQRDDSGLREYKPKARGAIGRGDLIVRFKIDN